MSLWFKNTDESPTGKHNRRLLLLLCIAALGVVLLLFGNARQQKTADTPEESIASDAEMLQYRTQLEERIKSLCQSVNGVGEVTVAVTLEGGFQSVYATEYQDGNESYVIVGSGSSAKPIFLSREAPKISGVGIVCRGGASASVRQELTVLVSAAFDIPSNRIYVTESSL